MSENKKSYIVFNLIKSMSQSEKRYFKMFISAFEGKNKTYLKIYNAIDKQKVYSEKDIKKKFAKEPFIKHFPVAKNNLYHILLKSLRFYHSKDDVQEKVNQYKSNVKILMRKGLFSEAMMHLDKAVKIAEEAELFEEQIKLSEFQISTNTYLHYKDHKSKYLDKKLKERFTYLEKLEEHFKFKNLGVQLDYMILQNEIRTSEAQKEIEKFSTHPLLSDSFKPLSVASLSSKFHNKIACFVAMKNYKSAFEQCEGQYKSYKTEKNYFKRFPFSAVGICNNYLFTAIKTESLLTTSKIAKIYYDILIKTKEHKIDFHDYDGRIFESQHHYILDYHLYRNEFRKLKPKLPNIEEAFNGIKDNLSPFLFILFSYDICYAHFGIGNFEIAQKQLLVLLNFKNLKSRKDYFTAVHLLNLYIHYEMGNYEHLSYQIKNAKQLIQRQKYLYKYEQTTIKLLSNLCKAKESAKKLKVLESYKEKFTLLSKQTCELDAFEKFNTLWWIDQKINLLE